jgi:hypothetical protein
MCQLLYKVLSEEMNDSVPANEVLKIDEEER